MDLERDGNLIEAGVWALLAVVVGLYALRVRKPVRATLILLAVTMLVFGGSDLVESRTGAWWRPWWLFVWKAACVLVLGFGFTRVFRLRRRSLGDQSLAPNPSAKSSSTNRSTS